MKCECNNPSCTEHPEKYRCNREAAVVLTDDNNYSAQLCKGCAESEEDQLELINPKVESLY